MFGTCLAENALGDINEAGRRPVPVQAQCGGVFGAPTYPRPPGILFSCSKPSKWKILWEAAASAFRKDRRTLNQDIPTPKDGCHD